MNKLCCVLASFVIASSSCAFGSSIWNVRLDTSSLLLSSAGPFGLAAQFAPGSGDLDQNNVATLSMFSFGGGGGLVGSPLLMGGTQVLSNGAVQLTDSAYINYFNQQFTPGTSLEFRLELTDNGDGGGIPDAIALYVTDRDGNPLPTLAGQFADYFLVAYADPQGSSLQTFPGDSSREPVVGGSPVALDVSAVSSVPEPGTASLIVVTLGSGFAFWRRSGRTPTNEHTSFGNPCDTSNGPTPRRRPGSGAMASSG